MYFKSFVLLIGLVASPAMKKISEVGRFSQGEEGRMRQRMRGGRGMCAEDYRIGEGEREGGTEGRREQVVF